jgi:hypothetical protein
MGISSPLPVIELHSSSGALCMKTLVAIICAVSLLCFTSLSTAQEESTPATSEESSNLLKPTNDEASWTFELSGDGAGFMAVIDDSAVFLTTKTTGENWHVQAYMTGLDLKEGQEYVVKFQAKSPESVPLLVVAQIHEEDWHEVGLHEQLTLSDEYQDFEVTFTASDVVEGNCRLGFVLGDATGIVYVKDLSLTEK